jgi:hypothetical protein
MSHTFGSLAEFATFLTEAVVKVEHAKHEALEEAAVIVETEAKAALGTYDYGWPQLAQSTQEQRSAQGFTPNDPGLRSGEMRDSLGHKVEGDTAHIGSDDDHLVYFELGTSKQPPRSDLAKAAMSKEKEVCQLLGRGTMPLLTGSKV